MEDNLKDTMSEILTQVLGNKYTVKVYDEIAEKYDTHEWNVSELITYLTGSKVKEIHLFNRINIIDFKLYKQDGEI